MIKPKKNIVTNTDLGRIGQSVRSKDSGRVLMELPSNIDRRWMSLRQRAENGSIKLKLNGCLVNCVTNQIINQRRHRT